jgi:hypothetical protein
MVYYPSEIQVTPLTKIRRERLLPRAGEVLVSPGDQVEAAQVIARANLPGDFRIIPVARLLDTSTGQVKRHLQVELGDQVQQGQTVAKRGGLLGRAVKSPIDGVVTARGGGRILIEAPPVPFELRAYIRGRVSNIMASHGAVVETTGAVIQGKWGSGGESFGVLKSLVNKPHHPLQARAINPSCHGTVIIGGAKLDEEGLERAEEQEVKGIITGGLPPGLLSLLKDLSVPVIATEGIGEAPMSRPIFDLLTKNAGRETSLNGEIQVRWNVTHPEIIIHLPSEAQPVASEQVGAPLTIDTVVRIIQAPYMGEVGTVVAIPQHPQPIETGAMVHCAEVELEQRETSVFIPLTNLEVLR